MVSTRYPGSQGGPSDFRTHGSSIPPWMDSWRHLTPVAVLFECELSTNFTLFFGGIKIYKLYITV
jgi:hypothetical protein